MLRIANASGFYGDRFSAVREMLTGGPVDVLTGDYLAELTMLILGRAKAKDPARGYATTFLRQMEECLGTAVDAGVTVVSNAGGLNPAGLADALRELADRLGLNVSVAHVDGDDLTGRADELGLGNALTANAYLGAFGIAECLRAGADVVVTGRVTDASVVVGPAAAHFGWTPDDHDALAGAVVAGHVIECGAQATGGNYAFFTEHDLGTPGFPLAELHADGSSVITKHPGTGGAVTPGTVTAQLLYEIAGPRYPGPDVTARFDSPALTGDGPDRVRISGVRGEPPPPTLKVGRSELGGFRNEVTFVLTGLDIEAKAALVRGQLESALAGSVSSGSVASGSASADSAPTDRAPAEVRWSLGRTDHADADTEEAASALLHCVVRDPDARVAGRAFSGAAVELALASYPGFHVTAPPAEASPYGIATESFVHARLVPHTAVLPDGTRVDVPAPTRTRELGDVAEPALPAPLPEG
ncbi:acyclic terpene utilization AtuA family protein, partial [Saccharomonospora halophila]|uniref:acyclic terpene utilization AtuA family protein n=1 Tax=Saccharomonospora halophila TaxID=129922 RepID=UPI000376214D